MTSPDSDLEPGHAVEFCRSDRGGLDRVRDVLAAFTRTVVHVGPHGSGNLLKLIANALWFEQAVATAEGLAIAARARLDPDTAQRAFAPSDADGELLGARFAAERAGVRFGAEPPRVAPRRRRKGLGPSG